MYVLLTSQTRSEEGDESPIYVLARKVGYMRCIYNSDLNESLYTMAFFKLQTSVDTSQYDKGQQVLPHPCSNTLKPPEIF